MNPKLANGRDWLGLTSHLRKTLVAVLRKQAPATAQTLEEALGRQLTAGDALNDNPWCRIGWGWSGPSAREVFRIAIGEKDKPIHWHIDLF
jgi:hypothetical protein